MTTTLGDIDLLGEASGGGTYESLLGDSIEVSALGVACRVVTLDRLIQLKHAAGRPKDFEAISELRALFRGPESDQ